MSADEFGDNWEPPADVARVVTDYLVHQPEQGDWDWVDHCEGIAGGILSGLHAAGFVVIPDEPSHFVTFDEGGWFVEHSVACRAAGTIGTCEYNTAVREIAEYFDPEEDPDQLGRWRITEIDSEGLPSLERVA